jgi:hypothetical protein
MTTYTKALASFLRLAIALVALAPLGAAAEDTASPMKFKSPEDAMKAIVAAVRADDQAKITAIMGPNAADILSSGDEVDDKAQGKRFAALATERTRFETLESGAMIAHIGKDDWPFAVPLVKDGDEWKFDLPAGQQELLNRRVGRNELKAIATMRAYVEAQFEYASRPRDGDGKRAYAQKVRSDPGQKNGLYWDDPTGKQASPFGPLVAEASAEGYTRGEGETAPAPYHGYYYRILTSQGPHAAGGARSYIKDGRMTGGFAMIAVPSEYGSSGVMTFLVGPPGIVYQKNLGEKSTEAAAAITTYDPDETWTPVRD